MELVEENAPVVPIVRAALNETSRGLVPLLAETMPGNHSARAIRIRRALAALQSKRVNDAIVDHRKREIEAAKRKPVA